MSTSEWALFLLEVNIMPPKRAREYTQKNCGMCIHSMLLNLELISIIKKCVWEPAGRPQLVADQWINWIFLHFTTFWIEFIYLCFLLASFMVEFLDCLHKSQADKLYLNFWGIFTRLKWMNVTQALYAILNTNKGTKC